MGSIVCRREWERIYESMLKGVGKDIRGYVWERRW